MPLRRPIKAKPLVQQALLPQREGASGPAEARLWVVGIGASAGGLEACTKLVSGLQVSSKVAFILVQHLDPTHVSMMAALLSEHTR